MKSLNAKTDISKFISLRYVWLELLKNKENVWYFYHNFKNILCYVTSGDQWKVFILLFEIGVP